VKRILVILAGLATLGCVAYLTTRLAAQAPAPTAPGTYPQRPPVAAAPASKIAIINVAHVIKNYAKYTNMQNDMRIKAEGYKKELEQMNAQITAAQGDAAKATTDAQREEITKRVKDIQRRGEDKNNEAQKVMSKMQYDDLVVIYKDIRQAVDDYARPRGIELVMQYEDGVGPEAYMPALFSRKMANNACQPIYAAPGVDITQEVLNMLNAKTRAGLSTAPAGTH
jgi:Skp family chaperone for outer membrane proteins